MLSERSAIGNDDDVRPRVIPVQTDALKDVGNMIRIAIAGHDQRDSRPERRTIDVIYRHALAWQGVVASVDTIGEVCGRRGGKVAFTMGETHPTSNETQDDHLLGADVIDLRHFLLKSGCAPSPADLNGRIDG